MISIAMATYNGEKYLREQIDSIFTQSIQDFELIVCDDCSSDSTVAILNEYAQKDSRIKVFVNEHNLGYAKNFEKAISLCKGDYIALSDQDDIWLPNHLELLVSIIGDNDISTANVLLVDANGNSLNCTDRDCDKIEQMPIKKEEAFFTMLYRLYIHGSVTLIKKEFAQHILPIPNVIKYHDAWIGLVAALHNGISYSNEIIMKYRQHGANQSSDHIKWNSFEKIKKIFFGEGNANIYITEFEYLSALLTVDLPLSEIQKKQLEEACIFYKNLVEHKQWKSFGHFLRNYFKMYRSRNPIYWIVRFVQIFILGK